MKNIHGVDFTQLKRRKQYPGCYSACITGQNISGNFFAWQCPVWSVCQIDYLASISIRTARNDELFVEQAQKTTQVPSENAENFGKNVKNSPFSWAFILLITINNGIITRQNRIWYIYYVIYYVWPTINLMLVIQSISDTASDLIGTSIGFVTDFYFHASQHIPACHALSISTSIARAEHQAFVAISLFLVKMKKHEYNNTWHRSGGLWRQPIFAWI